MNRSFALLLLFVAGCESRVSLSPSEQTSTGAGDTSTTGPGGTTALPEPTVPDSTTTTGSQATSSSGSSSADPSDAGCFLCSPDGGSGWSECSIYDQDCPPGEKCNPWSNDGDVALDAWRCVPVDPDPAPVGAACTGQLGSGIDACGPGAMCWDVDPQTNEGTCTPHCTGTQSSPLCADPAHACFVSGDGVLALCLPSCDPLQPDACPEGDGCYRVNNAFSCAPDASGDAGGPLSACEFVNACDPGLLCATTSTVGVCPKGAPSCCTPFCDLSAPTCPLGTQCVPLFDGEVPPGNEQVGMCGVP